MACKSGTLYTYPDNFRAQKCLIAAKYSGVKINVADKFVMGETNLKEPYLTKFPSGKVPAFESDNGVCLSESNAIAQFVATEELRGTTLVHKAQIQQWLDFTDSNILPASCTWVYPTLGAMQYNKTTTDRAKEDIKKAMKVLNDHFLHSTYLVGERITLADISLCCTMVNLYSHVMDPSFRGTFTNVNRWFNTMINQPNVKAVLGKVTLCEKMAQFNAKKYAELHGTDKKEKKKEEAKGKKESAKPAASAAPTANAGEEELKVAKPKDPFAALPAGTFDMDDFKRFYSNNDEDKSIPYFWEKFDKENYSIWRCDYKYSDELTMVFMSCNLIGGMFQRLDKMRKHSFASVCLFGENNNSTISGIWVWRGHDLAFELSEDLKIDYSSYDWKKLDADSPETKKMVEQYFKWEGTDSQGRKFNQGKIFK